MTSIDDLITPQDKIKLENTEAFEVLIIHPNNIEQFDWNDKNYLNLLLNQSFYDNYKINPNEFISDIAKCLKIKENKSDYVVTHLVFEEYDYIYEILYCDLPKEQKIKENENQMATLINSDEEVVYGSAVILKTHIPSISNNMYFQNMNKSELFRILYKRAHTTIVVYDDDWREEGVIGDISNYANFFFEEDKYKYKKLEVAFLSHNINIWYLESEYGENICGKLLNKPIEKCFWFTMLTDNMRGCLTLNEVKKIIELSNVLTDYKPLEELLKEENDLIGRNIVKNKYRILELTYQKHINKNECLIDKMNI